MSAELSRGGIFSERWVSQDGFRCIGIVVNCLCPRSKGIFQRHVRDMYISISIYGMCAFCFCSDPLYSSKNRQMLLDSTSYYHRSVGTTSNGPHLVCLCTLIRETRWLRFIGAGHFRREEYGFGNFQRMSLILRSSN